MKERWRCREQRPSILWFSLPAMLILLFHLPAPKSKIRSFFANRTNLENKYSWQSFIPDKWREIFCSVECENNNELPTRTASVDTRDEDGYKSGDNINDYETNDSIRVEKEEERDAVASTAEIPDSQRPPPPQLSSKSQIFAYYHSFGDGWEEGKDYTIESQRRRHRRLQTVDVNLDDHSNNTSKINAIAEPKKPQSAKINNEEKSNSTLVTETSKLQASKLQNSNPGRTADRDGGLDHQKEKDGREEKVEDNVDALKPTEGINKKEKENVEDSTRKRDENDVGDDDDTEKRNVERHNEHIAEIEAISNKNRNSIINEGIIRGEARRKDDLALEYFSKLGNQSGSTQIENTASKTHHGTNSKNKRLQAHMVQPEDSNYKNRTKREDGDDDGDREREGNEEDSNYKNRTKSDNDHEREGNGEDSNYKNRTKSDNDHEREGNEEDSNYKNRTKSEDGDDDGDRERESNEEDSSYKNRTKSDDEEENSEDSQRKSKETVLPPEYGPLNDYTYSGSKTPHYDPLQDTNFNLTGVKPIDLALNVPYLGVLVDAGRNYFSIDWWKRLIDILYVMRYNLIHFRLTDDQTFNVLLDSHPALAYPTKVDNPDRKVYSGKELRDLVSYATARNISIVPEINVPGHAGSWAAVPGLVLNCVEFVCSKGYGMLLNVTHPELLPILKDVLIEIIDIFNDPPFLHLGGDEVEVARPCFRELGVNEFDYEDFERKLAALLKSIKYPEERVVRWEMTGQVHGKHMERAGKMEHFWYSYPDEHSTPHHFFVSTALYFDVNTEDSGLDIYYRTVRNMNSKRNNKHTPTAIVAGTFELTEEFWYDRNVVGRLLAMAMGATRLPLVAKGDVLLAFENDHGRRAFTSDALNRRGFVEKYKLYCNQLKLGSRICETAGHPTIKTNEYTSKWRKVWEVWKEDICDRLTYQKTIISFRRNFEEIRSKVAEVGNDYFWRTFRKRDSFLPTGITATGYRDQVLESPNTSFNGIHFFGEPSVQQLIDDTLVVLDSIGNGFSPSLLAVPYAGVTLDVTSSFIPAPELHGIVDSLIAKMGFNLIHLPLVTNSGFSYESEIHNGVFLGHSVLTRKVYSIDELADLVQYATSIGIDIMPEIAVSTSAAGWARSGFLPNCPNHYCKGLSVPVDVDDPLLVPALFSVIGELLTTVFNVSSSGRQLIHLGQDERSASLPCFAEAERRSLSADQVFSDYVSTETEATAFVNIPNFDNFERRLTALMRMIGISPENILRWESSEGGQSVVRTGSITHYNSTSNYAKSNVEQTTSNGDSDVDKNIFLTVDLFIGNGWSIYQHTRKLVGLRPLAILAEVRDLHAMTSSPQKHDLAKRLLAFMIAVLEASETIVENDEGLFSKVYTKFCQGILKLQDCSPPGLPENPVESAPDSESFKRKACDAETSSVTNRYPKFVKPFY